MSQNDDLLLFFRALADPNRLKIAGLLAKQPYTVEELSALLGVSASTVSHHLSKLAEAGLVSASAQSYYNFYRLETDKVQEMAQRLLSGDLPSAAEDVDTAALERKALDYDQKVVQNYLLPDGRLKTIPAQQKKLLAVLRHIAKDFQPGKRYSEKTVNEMLARYHNDTATLRRELVGYKLMEREGGGGDYWRSAPEDGSSPS